MSMNVILLTGNLARDVELSYTPSGVPKAITTLAVNRSFKNDRGEREADFIPLVMWRKTAENAANHLKKGSKIGVRGRWQTRNFEGQDGKRVYLNECIVEELEFLTPLEHGQSGGSQQQQQSQQQYSGQPTYTPPQQQNQPQYGGYGDQQPYSKYDPNNRDPFTQPGNKGPMEVHEDDLPF